MKLETAVVVILLSALTVSLTTVGAGRSVVNETSKINETSQGNIGTNAVNNSLLPNCTYYTINRIPGFLPGSNYNNLTK